jgi:pyrimidine operon attenuation protein / uracil phosphoribosyltransferase
MELQVHKKYIFNKETAIQKLQRLSLEIAEQLSGDDDDIYIIGVRNNGSVIAAKIATLLQPILPNKVHVLTVSFDKDKPLDIELSINNINFNNANIIIADDVANSGKTLLYALKPLLAFHPKRIQTLVLVERMYKQFPIKNDYIGLTIATTPKDHISVEVINGEVEGAYIV